MRNSPWKAEFGNHEVDRDGYMGSQVIDILLTRVTVSLMIDARVHEGVTGNFPNSITA